MQYNTQREKLPMPEYGRGIQNMVNHALTLETKAERQRCAYTIVRIMGNMFPHLRDVPDFKHKLWDHLAAMADYKLDIDYPYEINMADKIGAKPQPMAYPMKRIRYRHYGYLLETLLKRLKDMQPGRERDELMQLVAHQMKRSLYNWNKDAMDDEKVLADLTSYIDGDVNLNLKALQQADLLGRTQQAYGNQNRTQKRNRKKN